MAHYGFFGNGERAWHNQGTALDEDVVSVEEAFQLVPELAMDVASRPLAYKLPDGSYVDFDSEVANVREDGNVVGVVSPDYKIIAPWRGARFLDELLQAGELKCHTGGTVKAGRQWWMLFRLPREIKIGGHDMESIVPFIMATNSFDRTMSFTLATTPVRVVCWNTIQAGLASARRSWSASHTGDLDGKMIEAAKALDLAHTYYADFEAMGNHLAKIPFEIPEMKSLVDRLSIFTPPQEDTDRKAENRQAAKDAILSYFQYAPNLTESPVQFTRWGAYNAVAEYSDWDRISRKSPKSGDTAEQNRFARIISDTSVKDEALSLLLA
jgi:phage/plasmid-like protein (TIGR03299 family)